MTKSTIFSALLAMAMLFSIVQHQSIATAGGFDATLFSADDQDDVTENSGDNPGSDVAQKKKGNTFVRVLRFPFRAIGRLFGDKSKSNQQARGISKKDAAKFESSKITRIQDANTDLAPTVPGTSDIGGSTADLHLQKGRELLAAGDVNNAIAELSIAASSPESKTGYPQNLLGIAYEMKGFRERALEFFKAAVHSNGNNPEFLNNYGYLLYKNNDFEAATKYLKRAANLSPGSRRIWNNLAMAQCQRGKFDDAYGSFIKAVGEFNGHLNIASQLESRGYAKDAIEHLEQARVMRPNSVEALTYLARLYEMTGRLTDAETTRRSLVALKTFAEANR